MTDRIFRVYLAALATVFVTGILLFAQRAIRVAEQAAENGRYQQIDYRMFSNDRVVSDYASFFDTRSGLQGDRRQREALAQTKSP